MSLVQKFRTIHRKTAPIVFLPLIITSFTGIIFYILTNWFGISEEITKIFIDIHEGDYLGDKLKPIYVLLVGLGLLGMMVTGLVINPLLKHKSLARITQNFNQRNYHSLASIILLIPLIISVITGVGYRISRSYFNAPKEKVGFLLDIHQGEFLGSFFQGIYIMLIGLGLLSLLITGIPMTSIFRKSPQINSNQ